MATLHIWHLTLCIQAESMQGSVTNTNILMSDKNNKINRLCDRNGIFVVITGYSGP